MRLTVNGITLNVVERGAVHSAFPTLVFLHYFGGSSRAWGPVMERLERDYRCVAPDLRGFGDSSAPTTGYAVGNYTDDVAALVGFLGLERYVLVGHSMGGKITLALAARRPSGLHSLLLLAPSPPTPEPMDDQERERLLSGHSRRAVAEETIRKITAQPLPELLFEQTVEDSIRSSETAWDAWLEHGSRENIAAQMPRVIAPVLVAVGEADPVLPASLLQHEVVERIAGARLTTLRGTGHLSPLEAPTAVADLIEGIIRDIPGV